MKAPGRYVLTEGSRRTGTAAWAPLAHACLAGQLTGLTHGPSVGRIVTSSLAPESYSTYGTGWRHWLAFCKSRELDPLGATQFDA